MWLPGEALWQQVLRERSAQPQPARHVPAPLQQLPVHLPPQHHTHTQTQTHMQSSGSCQLVRRPTRGLCIPTAAQSTAKVIRAHPYVGAMSLLTMAAIMTAGVVGVLAAADTETRHRKDAATGACHPAGGTQLHGSSRCTRGKQQQLLSSSLPASLHVMWLGPRPI